MKLSHIAALAACLPVWAGAMAQPVMKFDETSHNFGIFDEELETVSHEFVFTNTGNQPLVIENVRTTCGCTATEYSQDPIAPGAKGKVKVTFNATGRPGNFSKATYVYANSKPSRSVLRITGEVVKGSHPQSTRYGYKVGSLKLKSMHVPLSKVVKGKPSSGFIEVINAAQDTLRPIIENNTRHIRANIVPDMLLPGEEGRLVVTYDPDAIDDWGYRRDDLHLTNVKPGGEPLAEGEYNTISVSATITEDFDSMTAQEKADAPILVVGKSTVDFGVVEGSKRVSQAIYIANVGYSNLTIHKVRNENNIVNVKCKKSILKPGQTTQVVIEIDPKRAQSSTLLSDIYIVCNDPHNVSQQIRITAEFR